MNKILVVDDSSDIRLLLSRTLKAGGYTVSEATDGDEVLAATLSYEPDMILLDVAMPRVDGFKALALLKRDPRTKKIPVIMVTAKGHPSDLETARSLGALDYINKPWAHGEVELRVQWAITSVQRKRELESQKKLDRLAS
ncbi:MAG: response regulator [Chloroflexi bacterium]|nr:response regulator [Chloroflexota bacterium]